MNTATLEHQLRFGACLSARTHVSDVAAMSAVPVSEASMTFDPTTVNPVNAAHISTGWLGGVNEMGRFSGKYATKRINTGVLEWGLT